MYDETVQFSDRDERLDEVILAYLNAVDASQPIDRQEWLDPHPDPDPELLALFARLDPVDPLVAPLQNLSPTQPFQRNKIPSFGSFEDLTWIGKGGMGVVYKAWQKSLKRHVALKMILAGSHAGEELRARFQAEAEAAARLRHP